MRILNRLFSNKKTYAKRALASLGVVLMCFSIYTQTASALSEKQLNQFINKSYYYNVDECAPEQSSGGTTSVSGETTDPPEAVQQAVWDTLTSSGIDDMHAAAVMGNIAVEGVWDPMSIGYAPNNVRSKDPSKPADKAQEGYGLIGWTPGTRLTDMMKEANIEGKPYTAETQAAVIVAAIEGKTPSQYPESVGKNFLSKKNIADATTAFQGTASEKGFENPEDPVGSLDKRITEAKKMLREYGGAGSSVSTSGSSPTGQTACCSTGSEGGGDTALVGSDNAEKTYNFLIDKGVSPENTAAIVGNFVAESGADLNPEAENDSGAYGIAQWLDGRRTALETFASENDGKPGDLDIQLRYLWEVDIPAQENGGFPIFKPMDETDNIGEKAKIFEAQFERSGGALLAERMAAAKAIFREYGEGMVSGAVGEATACCADPAASLNDALAAMAKENGGKTSISVSSIDGQSTGQANGDVQMPTRSSYKIYTAYATLRAIEAGNVTWGSVKGNMERMIVNSDNVAAEKLRTNKNIGDHTKVTNWLQNDVGLSNKTVMGSGSADDPTGTNSQSTSDDFTKFLVLLEKQKLPGVKDKTNYERLLNLMKRASTDNGGEARDGIVAGVGNKVEVADKPGWSPTSPDPASNDVGIVYLKDNPYAISILSDKPTQWEGVANIAKEVHSLMSAGGGSDGCGSLGTGDILETVKSYAWPHYSDPRSDPKPEYKKAYDKAVDEGQYPGGGYTDCGAFVMRVMIDSGYEPDYNYKGKGSATGGSPDADGFQWGWLNDNWKKVNASTTKDLKPGDVAIHATHTLMYTGKIDGMDHDFASASLGGRVPMSGNDDVGSYTWYRKE